MNTPTPAQPENRSGPGDSVTDSCTPSRAPDVTVGREPGDVLASSDSGESPDPFPDDEYEPL